jgi:molybdate transport repressor ModE-like protein
MKIELRSELRVQGRSGDWVGLTEIVPLLDQVKARGSISAAAAGTGVSYRHAWGMLTNIGKQLGGELVTKERGRGSTLSALGEKLLWADRLRIERFGVGLQELADDVRAEFERALGGPWQAQARIRASHGYAVAALVTALSDRGQPADLKYRDSLDAVTALARGECDLAGFHLPIGEFRSACAHLYRPVLDAERHGLIHLTRRTQGLFVRKGNPLGVSGLTDLARSDIRFVNRQPGSGTRTLLDLLLRKVGVDPDTINGYASTELTHSAIAAFVASGMADLGFGVRPAAHHFGLDFIPVVEEDYFFAFGRDRFDTPALATIVEILRSTAFRSDVDKLDGYDPALCGTLVDVVAGLDGSC